MLSSKAKRELKIDQRQILIDSIEIGIPSPQQICLWGSRQLPNGKKVGLVKNSKTVNYKRFTPFRDGLFCERIFGPVSSLVCACGKKQPHSKVTFCEKCEVEYIDQRARRYRLGYISLLSPVTHIWYLKGRPSYLSLFLGKRKKSVVALAYCNAYLIEHGLIPKENQRYISPFTTSLSYFENLLQNNNNLCQFKKNQVFKNLVFSSKSQSNIRQNSCISTQQRCNVYLEQNRPNTKRSFAKAKFDFSKILLKRNLVCTLPACFAQSKTLRFCAGKERKLLKKFKNKTGYPAKCNVMPCRCKAKHINKKETKFFFARNGIVRFTPTNLTSTWHLFGTWLHTSGVKRGYTRGVKYNNAKVPPTSGVKRTVPRIGDTTNQRFVRKFVSNLFEYTFGVKRGYTEGVKCNDMYSKCNLLDSSLLTSYGTYSYVRQQTLPFLPTFVSHFYLRDALLNFIYSSAAYNDIPIMEYCHIKRWEPLQDVHKLMAHKSVDQFQNDLLYVRSFLDFSKLDSTHVQNFDLENSSYQAKRSVHQKLRPYKASQYRFKNRCFIKSKQSQKICSYLHFEYTSGVKRGYTKGVKCTNAITKSAKRKYQNSEKIKITEDNNTALLSHLELTTIREILSYTGGGALQQLLQQFDQHDLCKFLFAEKQILRVLYQKHLTHFDSLFADSSNINFTVPSRLRDKSLLLQIEDLYARHSYPNGSRIEYMRNEVQNRFEFLVSNDYKKRNRSASSKSTMVRRSDKAKHTLFDSKETKSKLNICNARINLVKSKKKNKGFDFNFHFVPGLEQTKQKLKTSFLTEVQKKPLARVGSPNSSFLDLYVRFAFAETKRSLTHFVPNETIVKFVKEAKKSDLQKKQIVRLSRRIYKIARRLKVTQLLALNHRRPEWMILSHLPVLPPELRPILQMSEKVIVASDLNIMYQRVIYRNNRHLRVRFIDFHLVTAIQRLVQDAVDRLMENGKGGSKPYYTQGGRPLKSLSDILKGKKGRFRLNLLGKRVDFSGRSVIVVAPSLKIHECGLPKDIALELYHYFLLRQLIVKKHCASIVTAKKMMKSQSSVMWDILRELMYHHPVLLNRAPTLHRLGIQAFQPKLVLGNAIWLHPLVCSGFNADFDGDQMGVHLPLSFSARAESWDLLWSRNNLLSPATGQPMLLPSQDMVLGFYYMTAKANADNSRRWAQTKPLQRVCSTNPLYSCLTKSKSGSGFSMHQKVTQNVFFLNTSSIMTSLQKGLIKLHTPIWLHWKGQVENENLSQTPLELRVQGFGLQQYVYEKYINSHFFIKRKVVQSEAFLELEMGHNLRNTRPYTQKGGRLADKSNSLHQKCKNQKPMEMKRNDSLYINNTSLQREKTKFLNLSKKWSGPLCTQTSSICTEPKTYYIRTTAGRVLLNNKIQGEMTSS